MRDIVLMILKIMGWIGPILLVLYIFLQFIFPLLMKGYLKYAEKKGDTCDRCKGPMINIGSTLYLIPVMFDHEHERSPEWYIRNAVRIESEDQIPAGNRACWMHVEQCQHCGDRIVGVMDFLKVREQEVLKCADIYFYDQMRELLEK